jgi:regulation of enolase protein 1 (concanavalin A-like superfamily)
VLTSVAFSPDGQRIFSCSDDDIKVWDIETGKELISILRGGEENARQPAGAISPDGQLILSGIADYLTFKSRITLWDATTGRERMTLRGHEGVVTAVAFSPDGERIASGGVGESTVKIWDVVEGEELMNLGGHEDGITAVAFCPDGKRIASIDEGNTIRIWSCEPQRPVEPIRTAPEEEARLLAFDDFDGKLSLGWTVLHADPSHYSLAKKPGYLTITTQKGDFYRAATGFKNLFLIDNPAVGVGDFQVTTCIVDFTPTAYYHQAGLVCFNDDDNYIKWIHEWGGSQRQQIFGLIRETQGKVHPRTYVFDVPKAERLWLRLSKHGKRYTYSTSTDGKSFSAHGDLQWGGGVPKSVGLLAMGGSPSPEIDAAFDFFEVRAISARPSETVGKTIKSIIPRRNLHVPEELQASL